MDFKDKVVLVTGASRGIGRAIAAEFAAGGASVAVHYNQNKDSAHQTLKSLPGGPHLLVQADIRKPNETAKMIEIILRWKKRIHFLVNNAGIFEEHPLARVDYSTWQESWRRIIDTNLIGPANVTYCAARHMMETGGGKIINVSSRGAFRGEPESPAYGASKAGLNAMSQSLAKALAPHKIFVYVVAPGWVATEMAEETLSGPEGEAIRSQSPLGRVAKPEEVAKTVAFLASEGTDFLTGCIVDINGASYLRT
ncbi:MAG: SDR family NAD(P)-dependent oxidoreductase [Acidobacteriota bacterium]